MTEDDMNVFFLAFGQLREAITNVSPQMKFLMLDATPRSKYTK